MRHAGSRQVSGQTTTSIEWSATKRRRSSASVFLSFAIWYTPFGASEAVAPGGGSVAAAIGALGAALGAMVANLSSHKRGWDDRWEEFSDWAEKGKAAHEELLGLIDADTDAFNAILAAFGLPNGTESEQADRKAAIQEATLQAIVVPFRTMEVALESMEVIKAMAENGNPNSVSDAGVGALCARTAVIGAHLNVQINSSDLEDKTKVEDFLKRGKEIETRVNDLEREILETVRNTIEK
jgi:glutamate formiminotransferase/formiminotetrahydrofolate cyclodeaminase